jgi:hypothetical protein
VPLSLLVVDAAMVVLSLAALLCAVGEYRGIVKHWHVLRPGLFSTAAAVAMVAYPRWTDLLEPERAIIAVVTLLAGAVRGRFMKVDSDRMNGVADLHRPADGVVVAAVQAAMAGIDLVLDIRAGGLTRLTPTIELILILAAAYLLGRSLTLWKHVRTSQHLDLIEK